MVIDVPSGSESFENAHVTHFTKPMLCGQCRVAVFAGPGQNAGNDEPGCIGYCHFPGTLSCFVLPLLLMQMCTCACVLFLDCTDTRMCGSAASVHVCLWTSATAEDRYLRLSGGCSSVLQLLMCCCCMCYCKLNILSAAHSVFSSEFCITSVHCSYVASCRVLCTITRRHI